MLKYVGLARNSAPNPSTEDIVTGFEGASGAEDTAAEKDSEVEEIDTEMMSAEQKTAVANFVNGMQALIEGLDESYQDKIAALEERLAVMQAEIDALKEKERHAAELLKDKMEVIEELWARNGITVSQKRIAEVMRELN